MPGAFSRVESGCHALGNIPGSICHLESTQNIQMKKNPEKATGSLLLSEAAPEERLVQGGPATQLGLLQNVDSSSPMASAFPQMPDNMDGDLRPSKYRKIQTRFNSKSDFDKRSNNLENSTTTSVSVSSQTSPSSTPKLPDTVEPRSHLLDQTKKINELYQYQAKSSIPGGTPSEDYAQQCLVAAYSSRLDPYALHPEEYCLLREALPHRHITTYLNIRNGILRLWLRNPLISITLEEAAGCAKDERFFGLAYFAYEWLLRRGYINFGCVGISKIPQRLRRQSVKTTTIVIVGAGMAGLGCARQIMNVLMQQYDQFLEDEGIPKVIVLEGRNRVGGRIYSHPLEGTTGSLPNNMRATAEMGAHVVTGFESGNPLHVLIRGQLALPYHDLQDLGTIYDIDGSPVNQERDNLAQKLYLDILERASIYKETPKEIETLQGKTKLIDDCRDPQGDDNITIAEYEERGIFSMRPNNNFKQTDSANGVDGYPYSHGKKSDLMCPNAAEAMTKAGWSLKAGVPFNKTINLDDLASTGAHPSLGQVMDEGVKRYQDILDLSAQDLRLLNWHFANLEYANACNLDKLSLFGWDQDLGNEFDGPHSQVIGGYQQVPYGLWNFPFKLDVQTKKAVTQIHYDPKSRRGGRVDCEDGTSIVADHIVVTVPLGVLKAQSIQFQPRLPQWKASAIERLGFGLLNKIVLRFSKCFWDETKDMFGLLREGTMKGSLDHRDYSPHRGRLYLFWNCMKTSGCPTLIGLMAGDAAEQAEINTDEELTHEVLEQLCNVFGKDNVSEPEEIIITRWGKDPFARGTYSYVGVNCIQGDYDAMAKPIGNLHFAGEATCATHPATVHGAFISGVRAASEVMDSIFGDIMIPKPLIKPKKAMGETDPKVPRRKRNTAGMSVANQHPAHILFERHDPAIKKRVYDIIGQPPLKPVKAMPNAFLIYAQQKWEEGRKRCEDIRRGIIANDKNNTESQKSGRNDVRVMLGQTWRCLSPEKKRPYIIEAEKNKKSNREAEIAWKTEYAAWEVKAKKIIEQHENAYPNNITANERKPK